MHETDISAAPRTDAPKRRLVVVLGMHRSGTSLTARALKVVNVDLGTNLLPPQDDNPTGFWEDMDVYALNLEILAALGSDWHHLKTFQDTDAQVLRDRGFFIRAVELIQEKLRDRKIFGVKDPRIAKLIPFWKAVFDHCRFDVAYVIAFRNPRSVVRSLETRNGFPPEKCYAMWLAHVVASLHWTRTDLRTFIDYDQLLDDPAKQLERLSQSLGLSIDQSELLGFERQFLRLGMRHFKDEARDLQQDIACFPQVIEMYDELLAIAGGCVDDDERFKGLVEQWHREFERQRPFLRLADHLAVSADIARRELNQREERLAEAEHELVDSRRQVDQLQLGLLKQIEETNELRRASTEQHEQLRLLSEKLRNVGEELASRETELLLRDEKIVRLDHLVAEKDAKIAEHQAEIESASLRAASAESHAAVLRNESAEVRGQFEALRDSTSWRITAPLRTLITGIRRLRSTR